ncbi:hypothetical protein [Phaeobacter inhibens]|uniref:Uncharacterized protein n=1 Tax=Phaeobacter inhibens TaxID=221822 RepID=A0A2I7KHE9_9RHOB|nr:hypothetical protein [Phaeobacter inhibens]AUR01994.1 hypothetical protein PhaeoP88_04682 [Phaeobacter inhibens]
MNIRLERIAYQIHWLIQTTGGDCTLSEMSGFTGASVATCRNITRARAWTGMYRKTAKSNSASRGRAGDFVSPVDDSLATLDLLVRS